MGPLGDNRPGTPEGKQLRGEPTLRGRREGVTFDLSWVDQNGDQQPETSGEDLPSTVTLLAEPLNPVIQPTWQIGRPKQSARKDVYALANGSEGSITNNVVTDADPNSFTFILKRELGDLVGAGVLRFAGRPTDAGVALGVDFTVTYEDANSDEHTDHVPAKFGFSF